MVARAVRKWIAERFGLDRIYRGTLDRRVARGPWYYGDGAALSLLLGVLVVTGMSMTLTYSPSLEGAYESIRYITDRQMLGWFVRGLHYWSAGLMVVMLLIHLLRQILVGGYKFPREGTWLIGVGLFFLVIAMSFTGYLLRWDERSIYALKVALTMFSRVPWIGEELVLFIQGGSHPGAATLTRLYGVHAIFFPAVLGMLVAWHIYLVIIHGITSKAERLQEVRSAPQQKRLYRAQAHSRTAGEHFFPETMLKSGILAGAVLALAVALTLTLGPRELYPPANLVSVSRPIEEWWFYWYSALIALLPPRVAPWFMVVFPLALFAVLVLLPFVDRTPWRGFRKRWWPPVVVGGCAAGLLVLTDLRRRSPWTGWPDPESPPVPDNIQLSPGAEEGRRLFAVYGCNSCHGISGRGSKVAVDFTELEQPLSVEHVRDFIVQPPTGIAMPAYGGRLSEDELARLTEFVLAAQSFPRSD